MKTTRDMSKKQFQAALKRNGFRPTILGLWYEDMTGTTSITFGAVIGKGYRIHRRATLAHLIQSRDNQRKKNAAPSS